MNYRVRIKMCGMTRAKDITAAIALGVDALGFVFYAKSLRYVSIAQAKKLIADIPPFVSCVAVLVNPEVAFVEELLATLPIRCLQFHGDESPTFCQQFNIPYIKAIPAINRAQIIKQIDEYSTACGVVVDTAAAGFYGGTGQVFDWTMLAPAVTLHVAKPLILAGGLHAANVQHAVDLVKPYAVDVCSGVEERPGIKDHDKMKAFVSALTVGVCGEK